MESTGKAALGISGVFEFRDKDGNILKTVEATAKIPLDSLGLSTEEAENLILTHNAPQGAK